MMRIQTVNKICLVSVEHLPKFKHPKMLNGKDVQVSACRHVAEKQIDIGRSQIESY